jgi:TPP-dependent pyruvate/acetoin dehydrogenase alpha subunit
VIATQLPQAVGAAYAARLKKDDCVVFGYMGDGATSEHDFHCALNFAGVLKVPVVFVCQNNQWAISVPFERQTASDGIAVKASAYGMPGVCVDGNDALAVVQATRDAHERARRGEGPTLLELLTYRRGGHSSSDDPTRYRDEDRVAPWLRVDPLDRYRQWLEAERLWDDGREEDARATLRGEMDDALATAEPALRPPVRSMFEDVYATLPPHLLEQLSQVSGDASGTAEGAFPL